MKNFLLLAKKYSQGKIEKDPKIVDTVIRAIDHNLKPSGARECKEDLYRMAEAIAKASGKLFNKICPEEREVLDELICFGWIDGIRRKLDNERTMQLISPRKVEHWARTYKERAAKLIDERKITSRTISAVSYSLAKYLALGEDESLRR